MHDKTAARGHTAEKPSLPKQHERPPPPSVSTQKQTLGRLSNFSRDIPHIPIPFESINYYTHIAAVSAPFVNSRQRHRGLNCHFLLVDREIVCTTHLDYPLSTPVRQRSTPPKHFLIFLGSNNLTSLLQTSLLARKNALTVHRRSDGLHIPSGVSFDRSIMPRILVVNRTLHGYKECMVLVSMRHLQISSYRSRIMIPADLAVQRLLPLQRARGSCKACN